MIRVTPTLVLAALLLGGCKPETPVATPAPAASPATAVASDAAAPAPTAADSKAVDQARPAKPSLRVQTFDGKAYDLAEHRGKWVIVNFWATWCNPCLKEIPDLDAFDKSRDDVEVIGLAYEEIERADMQAFLKEHVISYPIAVVDVYQPPPDFEVPKGLPMTYLIAPDGSTKRQFLGPVTSEDLAKAMVEAPGAASSAGTR